MSTTNATEYERGTKALDDAQKRTCGTIRKACQNPRAKGDHLCESCRDEERAKIRAELPPQGVKLVCSSCGERPTKDEAKYSAREGGPHWIRRRRPGVVGMGGFDRVDRCSGEGRWVLDKEVSDGR